jgi:transcriptional regulator with XRE-family HTH domain
LRALSRAGIGWKRAAELAGISGSAVSRLLFGGPGDRPPTRRVRPETAAAILAVTAAPAGLGGGSLVPSAGTRRRLQALVAIGWPQAQLAARLGVLPSNLSAMLAREQVTASTARAVTSLYDQLWDRPPAEAGHREKIAATRARNHARARSWPPPAAWDDQAIDNPAACPGTGWHRATRLSSADLAEEARDLLGQGLTRDQVAQRLGRTRYAVDKALSRHPDASSDQAREGAA